MTTIHASPATILKIDHVTKIFYPPFSPLKLLGGGRSPASPTRALDGVSFSLERGRILGILGPNGAGKTTLLKILSTLVLPDAGAVSVDGNLLGRDDLRIRSLIGLASSEERSFYWRLTGRQNLAFFAALYGLTRPQASRRIDELFGLFKITYQDKRFDSYSTGMKRKFELMRALIHDPAVLLLDEPTRSLDYSAACELREMVKALARRGTTALYATHDMQEAADIADTYLILDKGRVRGSGALEDLRTLAGDPSASLGALYLRLVGHD